MNYREYIGQVGLKHISKEELVSKIEYLYELIESNRHSYQEIIRNRDSKIESLINEKVNYRDLYESIKKELEELKDSIPYQVIQNLSKQLKKAHEALDQVEKDKNYLKVQLFDMTKMRNNWKNDHDYQYKCFVGERDRRQELEKELKSMTEKRDKWKDLAIQYSNLIESSKIDLSAYITNLNCNCKCNEVAKFYPTIYKRLDDKWNLELLIEYKNGTHKVIGVDVLQEYKPSEDFMVVDIYHLNKYSIYDKNTLNLLYEIDKTSDSVCKVIKK